MQLLLAPPDPLGEQHEDEQSQGCFEAPLWFKLFNRCFVTGTSPRGSERTQGSVTARTLTLGKDQAPPR